jgi:hypothetical protein
MKRILTVIGVVAMIVTAEAVAAAERNSPAQPAYTSSQIRQMGREAQTAEQYTELADYYALQQRMYRQKAVEQMHLWRERAEMVTPLSEKWPRPVDSARDLHDYYEYKIAQSAALSAKYDQLADTVALKQSPRERGLDPH